MLRQERSAGVVTFRADASLDATHRLYLLLDYGRHWDFPKGHVEPGEDDLAAALRELREETGIADAVMVPEFRQEIVYFFRTRQRGLIRKTVVFFLAQTQQTQVTLSHEHVDYSFEPFPSALRRLTFANTRHILQAAEDHLAALTAPRA